MDWYFKIVLVCFSFLILFGLVRICMGAKGSWTPTMRPVFAPLEIRAGDDADSAGEQRVRACLERYFDKPFGKVRPFFLTNAVTGMNLELDCYNDDLKLAAEYNGRQHYEYTPYFHANKEAFYNQCYRDELKKLYCRDHGIHLISVPYSEKNIEAFLIKHLNERYNK